MDRNEAGKAAGVFSGMWLYTQGYKKLSGIQRDQLGLPAMVQTERETSKNQYRDFTQELYPRDDERAYPKGAADFAKAATSGFRNLKNPQDGWADAMDMSNPGNMASRRASGGRA
jgi:hypothetical protein